jgi:uridylate kinase
MKTVVMSVGGSILFQDEVNSKFINDFKKLVLKSKCKFVVVIGGGKTARTYIKGLRSLGENDKTQSLFGIAITRFHAKFLAQYFGVQANKKVPHTVKEVKNLLKKNKIVFCGGLRYEPDQTSDSTAANLAKNLNAEFVNMTNVKGLYTKDPRKFRTAKFIPEISYDKFLGMAKKIEYKPGQHFVLDQHAAFIIKKYKVKTIIMDSDLKNFGSYLKGKPFFGTVIKS